MVDAAKLEHLSDLAKKLNSKSNNLNKTIDRLNEQLAELNIGIGCYLERPLIATGRHKGYGGEPDFESDTFLGYDKVDDKWVLCIKTVVTEYSWDRDEGEWVIVKDDTYTPLLSAPRDIRLMACERFDDLVDDLARTAEYKLEVIDKAERAAKKN